MRKAFIVLIILACAAVVAYGAISISDINDVASKDEMRVFLLYNPSNLTEYGYILNAYESVLKEEGVPSERLDLYMLLSMDPEDLAARVPALIFPDGVAQIISAGFEPWLSQYLKAGGSIAVIFDAGTKNVRGLYYKDSFFQQFTGVDHINYVEDQSDAYSTANIRFVDEAGRDLCGFPPGKVDETQTVVGYGYGKLIYPVAKASLVTESSKVKVLAEAVTSTGETYPAAVLNTYGDSPELGRKGGNVLYVNLPLGYIKAYTDDLPMRSFLRLLLFSEDHIPHLMNVPDAVGGVVLNWHVDSNVEWQYLPQMLGGNFIRPGMEHSFHVTAGDFLDEPGDKAGFDACGAGKDLVLEMAKYGAVGSHGGWGHNWFAYNIDKGLFGEEDMEEFISRNSNCLASITGNPVEEYSAPVGVHPQPIATKVIERQGAIGYYYTGDTGSGPNRSFYDGKMVSDSVWAFPVMPMGTYASLEEFGLNAGQSDQVVLDWLDRTTDYVIKNRSIRLIYSHPYNLFDDYNGHVYGPIFLQFFDYLQARQEAGEVQVKSITTFARFLRRLMKTEYDFIPHDTGLTVRLRNPEGLQDISVAIPRNKYKRPDGAGLRILEDDAYYYVVIEDQVDEKVLSAGAL